MGRFVVDSDAIQSAESMMRSTAGRLQSDTAAMISQLQSLQESWSGGASSAFQSVLQEWRSMQQQLEEALASLNQALFTAGTQYADTEAANTRMFAR